MEQEVGHLKLAAWGDEAAEVGKMVGVAIGDSFEAIEGNVAGCCVAGNGGCFHVDEDNVVSFGEAALFLGTGNVIESYEAIACGVIGEEVLAPWWRR